MEGLCDKHEKWLNSGPSEDILVLDVNTDFENNEARRNELFAQVDEFLKGVQARHMQVSPLFLNQGLMSGSDFFPEKI